MFTRMIHSETPENWQPPKAHSPVDDRERHRRDELREIDEHLIKVMRKRREDSES